MALWSFSEVSQALGTSIQNISNRKSKLKSMGFIEIDETGKEKINEAGYNWLINSSKQRKLSEVNKANNNVVNDEKAVDNTEIVSKQQHDEFIIKVLENRIAELKQQLIEEQSRTKQAQERVQYWTNLYINQNEEFKKLAFPSMLDTKEKNINNVSDESVSTASKSWWHRLFEHK